MMNAILKHEIRYKFPGREHNMLLKRLTFVLFALLITACKFPTDEVVDVGKIVLEEEAKGGPIRTEIARKRATPTPTMNLLPQIKAYFSLASSPDCEVFEDDNFNTVRSIVCREEGNGVKYDEWLLESMATGFLDDLKNSLDNQVIRDTNWFDDQDPDKKLGKFLQFTSKDGEAVILWTVTGERLSGLAFRTDGDHEALYQWWSDTASAKN